MKHVPKADEPPALTTFRAACPNATWEQMRNDPHHGGMTAYAHIRRAVVRAQRGLCAYCETRLVDSAGGLSDADIDRSRTLQRVEHFHPKSDTVGPTNWALHWPNLWAVCKGGSDAPPAGVPADKAHYLPPLPENLSCDSFKEYQTNAGHLAFHPEGHILAPNQPPTSPRLFDYDAVHAAPFPDTTRCAAHVVPGNYHADTSTLVSRTVHHLNLGCNRLNRNRLAARGQLDRIIADARKGNPGVAPAIVLLGIARRLFPTDPTRPWPPYFTLIRARLGEAAEQRLQEINYTG